jgi:peroxiredoxin
LEQHTNELLSANLQCITIGLGQPEDAMRVCTASLPGHTCLVDTTKDAYHAWGLRRWTLAEGLSSSVKVMRATINAVSNGHWQGKPTGDQHMMPATFIVDTDGIIRYAYYSKYPGDDPEIDELVAVGKTMDTNRTAE